MHYLYLLKGKKDSKLYIGTTADITKRITQHNAGQNTSTKNGRPWGVEYCEVYKSKKLALRREKQFKRFAKSYAMLKKRLDL